MFDAAHTDAILCAAEAHREIAVKAVTKAQIISTPLMTRADAIAAMELLAEATDADLKAHLVDQLRTYLTARQLPAPFED